MAAPFPSADHVADWLPGGPAEVSGQLALDDALLAEANDGLLPRPVVRCWAADRPTVVVGSSSRIDDEVDRQACVTAGVAILRRPSGGLAVLLGPGCLAWSVVMPCPAGVPPVEALHRGILTPLAAMLSALGPDRRSVELSGSCDLSIAGPLARRKVGGNALRIRRQAVLYHGTLLHGLDPDLLARLLRHPPREPGYRAGRPHGEFVASLPQPREALEDAVRAAFHARSHRTDWPVAAVDRLVTERYATVAWTERQ